jgi:hypothetical protein
MGNYLSNPGQETALMKGDKVTDPFKKILKKVKRSNQKYN